MSAYGICPHCGAPGRTRERRPDGNDTCYKGHVYPSKDAVMPESTKVPVREKQHPVHIHESDIVILDKEDYDEYRYLQIQHECMKREMGWLRNLVMIGFAEGLRMGNPRLAGMQDIQDYWTVSEINGVLSRGYDPLDSTHKHSAEEMGNNG